MLTIVRCCCVLFVVCCVLTVARWLLFGVRRVLRVACCLLFVVGCWWLVAGGFNIAGVACWLLSGVCFFGCWLMFVVC